ncbi:MAG: acyl-CoA dehydrogenase [Solibacillus sp.]
MTFTYENFAKDGALTLFDPLFTIMAVFSVLLLLTIYLLAPPAKVILIVSAFTIILATQLLMINGIVVDELNLNGATKTMILFGATVALQIAAIILAFYKKRA